MTKAAISVNNLGKLYRLSQAQQRHDSFREALTGAFLAPWRRMRELRGTQAGLDDFWALRDISFDVQPGQVLGIIGRNGAGKSTLLKILARIVEPTEGSVTLRGRVASLLEVGTGFHPELSGRENIYLNGSILGMKKREIDRQFDAIVDFAEVERFLDTPVKRYSSGMYVRLAFAVAAHLDPEILIVDEVLAVGDAEFQKKCLGKLKDVSNHAGRTVLFVSHNLAAIRTLCTHGVLLRSGRVALVGSAEECCGAYVKATTLSESGSVVKFKRPPSAPLWIESASVCGDGEPASFVPMGADLTLSVDFAALDPIRHPRIGYVIQSASGERLINSNNRHQPSPSFDEPVKQGRIECRLGSVPLMPGRYSVSLWLGDMAADHHVELESVVFEVTEHDLWGLGQLPPAVTPMWWPTAYSFHEGDRSEQSLMGVSISTGPGSIVGVERTVPE
jgi:lipopolysaccharide transport system ATP-binding protein